MVSAYDKLGRTRERTGNVHFAAAPGSTFETWDGRFMILTISGDALFRKLCLAMGCGEMADDPRYATHVMRWDHIDELNDIVARWLKETETGAATAALEANGIPFSFTFTVKDILEDPHYAARGNIETVQHPTLGTLKMQGIVPKMLGTPAEPIQPAPSVGQDNQSVFSDLLGMSPQEYEALAERRVV